MRLRDEPLEIVDKSLAAVLRVLVMPADVNCFLGADFLTVAAEDATELVDLEYERIAVALFVLARDELDAIRRADRRTQPARDTLRLAGFRRQHAMRATPPLGDRFLLLRI